MFKCATCGIVPTHTKEFRITTAVRKVTYLNQVRYDKLVSDEGNSKVISSFKTIKETFGTEIAEQKSYCKYHIPKNINVRTLDKSAQRINVMKINRGYRGEN